MLRQRRDLHPLLFRYARRVGGDDGEDDVVLVQHLVMFEIMQQSGGRETGIAGQKYRGARHGMRRLLFQTAEQRLDRHFGAPRFIAQDSATTPPG